MSFILTLFLAKTEKLTQTVCYTPMAYEMIWCSETFKSLTKIYCKMGLNIKPLADRVVIEPAAAEEKTAGGIIIPDTAKEKPQKGKVLAVGNGKPDEPMTVKVGDTVLYGKYSGTEISIDGGDYLMMREADIFCYCLIKK